MAVALLLAGCSSAGSEAAPVTTTRPQATSTTIDPELAVGDVIDAIDQAGLPVEGERDNTDGNCGGDFDCSRWVTTDVFTVIQWDTRADAQRWERGPSDVVIVRETITVGFQPPGGSTPAYDRAAFDPVLEALG